MPRIIINHNNIKPDLYDNEARNNSFYGNIRSRYNHNPGFIGLRFRAWKNTFSRIFETQSGGMVITYNVESRRLTNEYFRNNPNFFTQDLYWKRLFQSIFNNTIKRNLINFNQNNNNVSANNTEAIIIIQAFLNIYAQTKQRINLRSKNIDVLLVAENFNNNWQNINNKAVLFMNRDRFNNFKTRLNNSFNQEFLENGFNENIHFFLKDIVEYYDSLSSDVTFESVQHETPPMRRRRRIRQQETAGDTPRTPLGRYYQENYGDSNHVDSQGLKVLINNVSDHLTDKIKRKITELVIDYINFNDITNIIGENENIPDDIKKKISNIVLPMQSLIFAEQEQENNSQRIELSSNNSNYPLRNFYPRVSNSDTYRRIREELVERETNNNLFEQSLIDESLMRSMREYFQNHSWWHDDRRDGES